MSNIEHKSTNARVKVLSPAGRMEVYVATFGNVDSHGDVIVSGALANPEAFARNGVVLVGHKQDSLPVATVDAVKQDDHGILVSATFHTTPEAQDVRTVVKERLERGKSVKASIGFRTLDSDFEKRDGKVVRRLKSIELFEFSIVNVPANDRAEVVGVKGARVLPQLERLRERSREGLLKYLRCRGEEGRLITLRLRSDEGRARG